MLNKSLKGRLYPVLIIAILLFITNLYLGNPLSRFIATKKADNYIENNFEGSFERNKAIYNFKDKSYSVNVQSTDSKDVHFQVLVNKNDIEDTYSKVENKETTFERIESEYDDLVTKTLDKDLLSMNVDYAFGTFKTLDESEEYGVNLGQLELNKEYNIEELGSKHGHLVFYIKLDKNESLDEKTTEKFLVDIKRTFDSEGIPFKTIDFNIEKGNETFESNLTYDEI